MKKYFKFYGVFYIVILIIVISLGFVYLNNLKSITKSNLVPNGIIPDTTKPIEDLPVVKGTVSAPVDVAKEIISTPEKTANGKTLFEKNCVSCHGKEGKGDGVAGVSLNPPPRNLTVTTGWKNGSKISDMFKTLSEGIPNTAMAQYNNLTPQERFDLILFIKSINSDLSKDTPEDIKNLDTKYSLSAGIKQPNQIPVLNAVKILVSENSGKIDKIKQLVLKIENEKNEKGALIFKRFAFDLNRAVISLYSYTKWNENENQFVDFIVTSPDQKGFHAGAVNISKEELTILFQYLKSIII